MQTYYLVFLHGGIFNAAYLMQATDYDEMVQKSLNYCKELYRPNMVFDMCILGNSVYVLEDDVWVKDEDADFSPDKFEIIAFEAGAIIELDLANNTVPTRM